MVIIVIPYDIEYGNFSNYRFSDMFPTLDAFLNGYKDSFGDPISLGYNEVEIPKKLKQESIKTLYYLLYGQYGGSTITGDDQFQWCYQLFSIIFMYGPTWERRLQLQDEIRAMSINDAIKGAVSINNQSLNPSEAPVADSDTILKTINTQTVNKFNKSKVEGYQYLIDLLETDVTKTFLDRFKVLFLKIVAPQEPLWYATEIKEGN